MATLGLRWSMKLNDLTVAKFSSETVSDQVPRHVAIIMDGNGRWANKRGLPRLAGHRAGTDNIHRVIEWSVSFGIEHLTIYAFSTENWDRPPEEVKGLMSILEEVINNKTKELHEKGVRLQHLGKLDRLSPGLQRAVCDATDLTSNNKIITLNVAFNYGGRAEILEAVRGMVRDGVSADVIDEDSFRKYLYIRDIPDPDLIIRTAGEMRMSNFLLWQAAYSEYYSTPVLWPDFDKQELQKALDVFGKRTRSYGKV